MSIASEISRLQTAKADMKTALEAKGVIVGAATLDTYDTLIAGISAGTDISDADAAVTDVVASKTFYAGSTPIKTGTMVDRGTVSTDITTVAQEVTIAAGKHSGSGVVKISATEQAKIIAANIKKDIVLLGVTGTVESGAGGTYSKVVRQLTSSGTWTKPTGLTHLEVVCIGGGGSGQSGAKRASGAASAGGASGGAGSIMWGTFLASELGATEDYTVGAGATGGASQTSNNSAQNAGAFGGSSFFSGTNLSTSKVYAQGGLTSTSTTTILQSKPGGMPGLSGVAGQTSGVGGSSPTAQNTSTNYNLIYGGGGGAGITSANAQSAGGSGARYYNKSGTLSSLNGGAVATDGGDGVNYYMDMMPFIMGTSGTPYADVTIGYGTPGGGGGSSTSGNAGRGGDGGLYGGAGGGGGAARNDVGNSGRGGNGGAGVIILIEHIVA